MSSTVIRCIISAVVIGSIEVVITFLHNRSAAGKYDAQSSDSYVVRVPKVLQWVYLALSVLGLFLFTAVLITMLLGNPTATTGHLVLFLVIAGIGLLVQVWASRWRITVRGNQIEIHRLFHKCIRLSISQLDRAELETKEMRYGLKQRLLLYQSGKKLLAVDGLSDHYEYLVKTLEQYEKI